MSDADLHAAYEKNKSRLNVPEKRHARHILITGKDDASALALAQQVLEQAKAGKDFGALAKQYSQDPGSAKDGGDLRLGGARCVRSSLCRCAVRHEGRRDQAARSRPSTATTSSAWMRCRPARASPSRRRAPDLDAQLRRDRATDRFGEIQEQLQTKLAEPGADLATLAQEFHLSRATLPAS